MNDLRAPSDEDIIRVCITLLRARKDENEVKKLIERELAYYHPGLHPAILKVVLRVVVAQFFKTTANRVDHEIGWEFVDAGLDLQEAATNGALESDEDNPPPLAIVNAT
ncbi:hypothetical protein ACIBH1_05565 [Nonomuraea sp. NPDC050663]|uniref:hypothetical protein n=1 Tax=Nonomuraea sp. NPDC050663 TaxID=3364370 RepID=UPI0037BC65F4